MTFLKVFIQMFPFNFFFFGGGGGRLRRARSRFGSNNESVVRNLFTSRYIVDSEGTEILGNGFLNLLPHNYMMSSQYG
jgi:hypothetical protein